MWVKLYELKPILCYAQGMSSPLDFNELHNKSDELRKKPISPRLARWFLKWFPKLLRVITWEFGIGIYNVVFDVILDSIKADTFIGNILLFLWVFMIHIQGTVMYTDKAPVIIKTA